MKNPQKRRKKWCVGPEKVVRKPCLYPHNGWLGSGIVYLGMERDSIEPADHILERFVPRIDLDELTNRARLSDRDGIGQPNIEGHDALNGPREDC